mgnify:FL=1
MLTLTLEETVETMETTNAPGANQSAGRVRLIPGETERPKFVVIDELHEEDGHKYRPGVWHFGIKHSKSGDGPATLTKQWVCSPLHIDAVTTDAHAGNYGRLLRF